MGSLRLAMVPSVFVCRVVLFEAGFWALYPDRFQRGKQNMVL